MRHPTEIDSDHFHWRGLLRVVHTSLFKITDDLRLLMTGGQDSATMNNVERADGTRKIVLLTIHNGAAITIIVVLSLITSDHSIGALMMSTLHLLNTTDAAVIHNAITTLIMIQIMFTMFVIIALHLSVIIR